jgi:hypothetical protein
MSGFTLGPTAPATVGPNALAQSIHDLLSRRGLPDAQFERLWGGRGTHCRCDACGRTISGDDVEYELEFRQGARSLTVMLHRDCWEEWRQV